MDLPDSRKVVNNLPLTDEVTLNIDGYVSVDPANWVRQQSQSFLDSRQWTTPQVYYGDQSEPQEENMLRPVWSITFVLGLNHVKTTKTDWHSDVSALFLFVQSLQATLRNEFIAEVRYASELWHSEHIAFIDEGIIKFETICDMIERVI